MILKDLCHLDLEPAFIVIHKVPCICRELSLNIMDDPFWPIYVQPPVPPKEKPEHVIKTYKMIHMCVGYKHICYLVYMPGGKAGYVSDIEQAGTPLIQKIYIKAGVFKWPVYQSGMKIRCHRLLRQGISCL